MSQKLEGKSCALCHAYLFDDDDIVYCPICGAPHHRECYNSIGHCALEDKHGTDEQYDKIKHTVEEQMAIETESQKTHKENESSALYTCQMCGEKYDPMLKSCPKCGAPNISRFSAPFAGFDFLGGVPADYNIGEGITADEAKRFVLSNTPRYIPKFATLNKNKRVSWNWFAFFFPCGWFLSRKMYKSGIIAGALKVAASMLTIPLSKILYASGIADSANYVEMIKNMQSLLPDVSTAVVAFSAIGAIAGLIIRLFTALFGDYKYKNYTINSIKKIKKESEDVDFDFRKKGGINFVAMILGVLAVEYLPTLIATLL